MRKRVLTLMLASIMAVSLIACGGKTDTTTDSTQMEGTTIENTAQAETGELTTEKSETPEKSEENKKEENKKEESTTQASTEASTQAAATTTSKPIKDNPSTSASTAVKPSNSKPNKKPSTSKPNKPKPQEKPATTTEAPKKEVSITTIVNAVKKAYGASYVPDMDYDATDLEEKFGIKKGWYEEAAAQGPMISMNVDTFIIVKAKTGKAANVKKALTAYRQSLIDDTMQYPINKAKIPGSRVDQIGDYVFFTLLGTISQEIEEQGDEAILAESKKQCKIAYDTVAKLLK